MIDTKALAREIMDDAKAIWDDPDAIHAFASTHKTHLTIDPTAMQGQRVGVLHMVARVRLEGRYEWTVMDCIGGDILLMITRQCAPESIHDRDLYPRPSLLDDNDVYYPRY